MNGFSVIMPTYNQASFIRRAILSLFEQTYQDWELILINDGCNDNTEDYINEYLSDSRIIYIRNKENRGMGYAINQGLDIAKYEYIAYLPSDDYFFETHLQSMFEQLEESEDTFLLISGIKFNEKDSCYDSENYFSERLIKGSYPQLVQVAHKKTDERWVERNEFVSEDLFRMFWYKLTDKGFFRFTNQVTVNWSNHPHQRHKIISDKLGGGINYYRRYYQVREPIQLKANDSQSIDENKMYAPFRQLCNPSGNGLKILIVGELAFNPERIFAFEEAGHQLYGLWVERPLASFNTVGPIPFGNVVDIPYKNWKKSVEEIQPDIIYATLNIGAISLAHEVLMSELGIPFIWHFKEGPSLSLQTGTWGKLIDLYTFSDGQMYINQESKLWYEQFFPVKNQTTFILDGDLPKIDYFTDNFSPRLSETDGEIHTVASGRVVGLSFEDLQQLAQQKIHLHLYVQVYLHSKMKFVHTAIAAMRDRFHLHPPCTSENWVKEFSQYDAGWLHCFKSQNAGHLIKAGWDDLNIPARMSTLAAAGLPMLQYNNQGHIVAMQARVESQNLGICFDNFENLGSSLRDEKLMQVLRENVLKHRKEFSFDYHVPSLINFFKKVIDNKKRNGSSFR